MTIDEAFEAIRKERERQDEKWGPDKPQSLPGYMLIIESELDEAKFAWAKDLRGRHAPLAELLQVAAVAVACLERYGVTGSAVATNDIPAPDGQADIGGAS